MRSKLDLSTDFKKVGDVLTVIVSPISNVSFVAPPTDGEKKNLADAA